MYIDNYADIGSRIYVMRKSWFRISPHKGSIVVTMEGREDDVKI